jgi:hypothetical protein
MSKLVSRDNGTVTALFQLKVDGRRDDRSNPSATRETQQQTLKSFPIVSAFDLQISCNRWSYNSHCVHDTTKHPRQPAKSA